MTQSRLLVTILINNYNYGRFLRQAIDSALNQTYKPLEVLVVDDGSTDNSRQVISSYGDRIRSVLKENGGQASAFNAGIAASRGEVICMLDSDDFFYPEKVERIIPYSEPNSILYHRVQLVPGIQKHPGSIAPQIDYYLFAKRYGYVPYMASPTSGLAIRRDLALSLLPLPSRHARVSADDFVVMGAALLGKVIGVSDVLAGYRVHGENAWYGKPRVKSHEFMAELEEYLNRKLIEAGKEPVIDLYHSMCAMDYVPQNIIALARLGLSAFRRHPNFLTLKFVGRAMLRAFDAQSRPASSS